MRDVQQARVAPASMQAVQAAWVCRARARPTRRYNNNQTRRKLLHNYLALRRHTNTREQCFTVCHICCSAVTAAAHAAAAAAATLTCFSQNFNQCPERTCAFDYSRINCPQAPRCRQIFCFYLYIQALYAHIVDFTAVKVTR